MALQTSGSGAVPALSMSATDISVELGNSLLTYLTFRVPQHLFPVF